MADGTADVNEGALAKYRRDPRHYIRELAEGTPPEAVPESAPVAAATPAPAPKANFFSRNKSKR